MIKLVEFSKRYLSDESGVTAMEYAGLGAAIYIAQAPTRTLLHVKRI